ncbi:hypothetical protein BSL78_17458 [Apostichopus japonicus]|uniref:Uncharacterized protein n=1 Tax=Stichopus japonicus TaxID=307972 RepID=A0A2G8KCG7_STIJA|nr:hypothetical protein BSL78_17458 [Apostichopus japonicus]
MCKHDHIKQYGYNVVLEPLINDLKDLATNGIYISSVSFDGNVNVGIAQITGDNLGMNSLLGFVESFTANHPCRQCRVHRNIRRSQLVVDLALKRNRINYAEDVNEANLTMTGIKNSSIFNELEYFHVTENYAPDVMHDILEGVGPLEFKLVMSLLIADGRFSLSTLNGRITSYSYGFPDNINKPCCLSEKQLQNPDGATGQSAGQMWALLRHIPLIIGDLVNEDNIYWELLLMLLQCMDFIFAPCVTFEDTIVLKNLLKDHHELYLTLFPDRHLKPKHHFMLHYPEAIRRIGPVINFWCMRFEGKHFFFKRFASIINNFKNPLKSMAVKHQMNLCHRLLSGKDLNSRQKEIGNGENMLLAALDSAHGISVALGNYPMYDDIFIANWVKLYGVCYRPGMMVVVDKTECYDPVFAKIVHVAVLQDGSFKLICELWETILFSKHYHAYAALPVEPVNFTCILVEELVDFRPLHANKSYSLDDDHYYIPENQEDSSNASSSDSLPSTIILSTSGSSESDIDDADLSLANGRGPSSHSPTQDKKFDVRAIIEGSKQTNILTQLDQGFLGVRERLQMVRILVSHLIEKYGQSVGTNMKISLAKAVVTEFPHLKDCEGEGYEAWYTKAHGKHPATGYLEERLPCRKRSRAFEKQEATPKEVKKPTL